MNTKSMLRAGIGSAARPFEGERALVATGLLGLLLAAVCGAWVLLYGGTSELAGGVTKAASFNAALGIFLLSTAAITPYSALGPVGRGIFRWFYVVLALYSYFAETVQHFRGVNPRFVENGSVFDHNVAGFFGITAMLLVALYVFFAASFFVRHTYLQHPLIVLGIRYAMIAVILSLAAGIWISVNQGRFTGLQGNIIWLHGAGFHALQVIPLIGWLAGCTAHRLRSEGHAMVHAAGLSFLVGLSATGWHTYLGRPMLELSPLPLLALVSFQLPLCLAVLMIVDRMKVRASSAAAGR